MTVYGCILTLFSEDLVPVGLVDEPLVELDLHRAQLTSGRRNKAKAEDEPEAEEDGNLGRFHISPIRVQIRLLTTVDLVND